MKKYGMLVMLVSCYVCAMEKDAPSTASDGGNPYSVVATDNKIVDDRPMSVCEQRARQASDCCETCCLACVVGSIYCCGRVLGACFCPGECGERVERDRFGR